MENQWGIDEEDPNSFLPQPENPYAGMNDIDRGGNQPYQGGVYDSVAQPNPWGVQDDWGGNGANGQYQKPTPTYPDYGDTGGNGANGQYQKPTPTYPDYGDTGGNGANGKYQQSSPTAAPPINLTELDTGGNGLTPRGSLPYTASEEDRGSRNAAVGRYTPPPESQRSGLSGSGTKRLEDLPKVDYNKNDPRGKDSADKGANIVSPANSGGGQPRASSGGGGGGQPQQYGQSQGQGGQPQQSYRPPANWDENAYLKANPDVAAAVRAGTQKSGYDHFANYGVKEGRTMTAAQQQPQADPRITRAEEAAKQAQAQMQAMQQAQQQQREAQARSNAQNQILSARVVGTGAGGEQIVRFTEGTPRGYTPDFAALSASTGLGAASLMRAWRDQGGQFDGEIMPMRGGNVSAPSAAAPTTPVTPTAPTMPAPTVATPSQVSSATEPIVAQPVATTGADKYLTPEQRAGNMVAPGSVPTTNPWGLQEPPQVVPQITTGTNYTNNGSADRWEFDPIQGVWINGRGDTRPYEDNLNAPNYAHAMVGGNVMPEQRVGVDGNIRMPINPATGRPYALRTR